MAADGPRDDVLRTLQSVPGVETVEPDAHDPRVWVVTGAPSIGTDAMQALIAAGYTPWLMRDRGMNLDEIYQQYFTASAAADAAAFASLMAGGTGSGAAGPAGGSLDASADAEADAVDGPAGGVMPMPGAGGDAASATEEAMA